MQALHGVCLLRPLTAIAASQLNTAVYLITAVVAIDMSVNAEHHQVVCGFAVSLGRQKWGAACQSL